MKKQHFTYSAAIYYGVVGLAAVLTFLYVLQGIYTLIALRHYQKFVAITGNSVANITPKQHHFAISSLKAAIHLHEINPQYYFELGSYLHRYYAELSLSGNHLESDSDIQAPQPPLKTAVMLDPGNPWNYYELGRLSIERGDCVPSVPLFSSEKLRGCSTARYFEAALTKAPYVLFLRRIIGGWYYRYDPDNAFQMIQNITAPQNENPSRTEEALLEFSKFLYEIHFDYESDLHYHQAMRTSYESEGCSPIHSMPLSEYFAQDDNKLQKIEFGNDDGGRDWKIYLTSDTERVKKTICLPKDASEYEYAAIKIFMNNVGSADFVAEIRVDEHLIKRYDYNVPRYSAWHEIPFDVSLLQGKSRIHIYIRVFGASYSRKRNYLQIFGDQETPTTHSVFNFHKTDDLSSFEGQQTGEYMIRLVLGRKVESPDKVPTVNE